MKLMKLFYFAVLISMTAICVVASIEQNVFDAAKSIGSTTWGVATFMDVYFAFLTIIFWIFARESSNLTSTIWAIAILALGNLAIAAYMLLILFKEKPTSIQEFFLSNKLTHHKGVPR